MKKALLISASVLAILTAGAMVLFKPLLNPSLEKIHTHIVSEHQNIEHLTAEQFENLNPNKIVVFDVRETEEYAVSHIDGAIQVQPNIEVDEFSEDYSDMLDGKTAVFYCSVGRRSSDLLARLSPVLKSSGVNASANLKGGIFNWVNQNKKLDGDKVHPYNAYWGRLVEDPSNIAYKPEN